MQNRKFKKLSTFIAATMLSVVTIGTTAFASPQLLFDSEEGIGIEVHCSNPNARGDIEDNYTSVAGGMLWTTWRNGKTYRANYDHSSKEHRCTALNGDGVSSRSAWTAKGITARSGFIPQTIINSNFAHRFCLCTLKIQYLAGIRLSKFTLCPMPPEAVSSTKQAMCS